jgi:excisionase family DNA binding protein
MRRQTMRMVGMKEAAEQLGVDPSTIRRWVREGRIPPGAVFQPGKYGRYRIDLDQILGIEPVKKG